MISVRYFIFFKKLKMASRLLLCVLIRNVRNRIQGLYMHHLIQTLITGRHRVALFLIGMLVIGCTYPSERHHPQFPTQRQTMSVLLVVPPEIRIFEQLADGGRRYQESQSRAAQNEVQTSIVQALRNHAFGVRTVETVHALPTEMDEVSRLFRSVNRSIQLHTYGPQVYPAKLDTFEYSVGSVDALLRTAGADGLVLAIGHQTGSQKPNENWFSLAVIEPQGSIIWYNLTGMPGRFDFHNPTTMASLVAETMRNFWEQAP